MVVWGSFSFDTMRKKSIHGEIMLLAYVHEPCQDNEHVSMSIDSYSSILQTLLVVNQVSVSYSTLYFLT